MNNSGIVLANLLNINDSDSGSLLTEIPAEPNEAYRYGEGIRPFSALIVSTSTPLIVNSAEGPGPTGQGFNWNWYY